MSPFQPEKVSIEAGKIMLKRIQDLISQRQDFAFETTLSSRSIVGLIENAHERGYTVSLIYYWLNNIELAIERVSIRVSEGGHSIPPETIRRRYFAGIQNFINLYKDLVDNWFLIDNSKKEPDLVSERKRSTENKIFDFDKWNNFNFLSNDTRRNQR